MWGKVLLIIFIIASAMILVSCAMDLIKFYPQDNFVEEIVEEVLEQKTGVDVDLSPFTPEKV